MLFLARKLAESAIMFVLVTASTFAMMAAASSAVVTSILGTMAPPAAIAAKTAQLGLNQPILTRYAQWLIHALHGHLGTSWMSGEAVTSLLANNVPVTLSLVIPTVLLSGGLGIALGVAAAVRGGWLDRILQASLLTGSAVPSFILAVALTFVFSLRLGVLPAIGYAALTQSPLLWAQSIVLPVAALSIIMVAATSQQVRGSMVDVLRSPFLRTLRSRGIGTASLYFKHALRTAAPPALAVLGLQTIGLIGGTVVIEMVFGLHGLGTMIITGASAEDLPVVMGAVATMVLLVIIINLLLDVAQVWLDPKLRTE